MSVYISFEKCDEVTGNSTQRTDTLEQLDEQHNLLATDADKFYNDSGLSTLIDEYRAGTVDKKDKLTGNRASNFNTLISNNSVYVNRQRRGLKAFYEGIASVRSFIAYTDMQAFQVFKTAHATINETNSADVKAVVKSSSKVKDNNEKAAAKTTPDAVVSSVSTVSSIKDASGNTIDLDNYKIVPFSTNYTELNNTEHQKVLMLTGVNMPSDIQTYFTKNGYALDGFGLMGLAAAESRGGSYYSAACIFGTNGGSGHVNVITPDSEAISTVATLLVQAGVCSDVTSATEKVKNDNFYYQLASCIKAARNTTNDKGNINTAWTSIDPNKTNLRIATERWRNNYQTGAVDMDDGGTGVNGGRYTYKSY